MCVVITGAFGLRLETAFSSPEDSSTESTKVDSFEKDAEGEAGARGGAQRGP